MIKLTVFLEWVSWWDYAKPYISKNICKTIWKKKNAHTYFAYLEYYASKNGFSCIYSQKRRVIVINKVHKWSKLHLLHLHLSVSVYLSIYSIHCKNTNRLGLQLNRTTHTGLGFIQFIFYTYFINETHFFYQKSLNTYY